MNVLCGACSPRLRSVLRLGVLSEERLIKEQISDSLGERGRGEGAGLRPDAPRRLSARPGPDTGVGASWMHKLVTNTKFLKASIVVMNLAHQTGPLMNNSAVGADVQTGGAGVSAVGTAGPGFARRDGAFGWPGACQTPRPPPPAASCLRRSCAVLGGGAGTVAQGGHKSGWVMCCWQGAGPR